MIRRFLLALAMLGALWTPPAAAASCSAANTYNFAFNNEPAGTMSYATTYNYTAATSGGATQNFSMTFATNGLSSSVVNTGLANVQLPAISNIITGVGTGNTLVVGGTFAGRTNNTMTSHVVTVTFTFATPIRDFTITTHDVDYTFNQFRDWLWFQGSNGASSYTPTLTAGGGAQATLVLGPNATYPALTAGQAVGIANNPNTNSNLGDVTATFPQPVTTVTLTYGNYPYMNGENTTGQQAFGISTISFCPMPAVTMTKTSAPFSASGPTSYRAPGSDMVYTITVTNTGGSPVDASTIVLTDALPTQVSFYNGAFAPAATPFLLTAGTSGVTLAAANVTYSNNGTTYTYTPAAGYDANVKGIKFSPQGTMAANSSFTIQYRVQIK